MSNSMLDVRGIKSGDIVGFSGNHPLSLLINVLSYGVPFWGISHMGIVARDSLSPGGRRLLWESTTLGEEKCEIRDEVFAGTQAHGLFDTIANYDGKVYHYPLHRRLYAHEKERLTAFLTGTVGTPYDQIGAIRSGGFGYSIMESLFRKQNLASIFCSEWCAAALSTVGVFQTANASRWNPNRLIRKLRWSGILRPARRIK